MIAYVPMLWESVVQEGARQQRSSLHFTKSDFQLLCGGGESVGMQKVLEVESLSRESTPLGLIPGSSLGQQISLPGSSVYREHHRVTIKGA